MTHVDEANQHINALLSTSKEALAMISPEKRARLKNALDGSEHLVPKREAHSRYWTTMLDIVQYGLESNPEKVRAYAELLLEKLEEDEQETVVGHLKRVLSGDKGQMIHIAEQEAKDRRWIKAQNIQQGDTVLFSIYEVKIAEIDALLGTDKLTITTDTGHKHTLKTWQDVQVLCEQEG
jgi:co-chaperonin GroES (HSP10)